MPAASKEKLGAETNLLNGCGRPGVCGETIYAATDIVNEYLTSLSASVKSSKLFWGFRAASTKAENL
ncbi:MAG TPA: hypothetical protein EYQ00_08660 [Dehalococcoidia bacterium]|nr:hypothetical protein [Dehalococcoidia bacterium]